MGTTQPTTKRNTNTNTSRRGGRSLFSFGACFGFSSPKKQHKKNLYNGSATPSAAATHNPVEYSVTYGGNKPKFSKYDIPTSESIKEIQIVAATAAVEAPPPHLHQVNNKTSTCDQGIITEEKKQNKNKNKQEQRIPATVQEISTNPIKLKHTVSLPAKSASPQPQPKKGKTAAAATGKGGNWDEMTVAAGKFDSMVGASMITLTLVVMLIWGKVCAILCSAAWVFFAHCFKQSNESFEHKNALDHQILDLDSHEYKKRVVLKGFLERI